MLFDLGNNRAAKGRLSDIGNGFGQVADLMVLRDVKGQRRDVMGSLRLLVFHITPDTTWQEILSVLPSVSEPLVQYLSLLSDSDENVLRDGEQLDLGLAAFLRIPSFKREEHVARDLIRLAGMLVDQLVVWTGGVSFDSDKSFTADLYTTGLRALGFQQTAPRWIDPVYYRPFLYHRGGFAKGQRFQLPSLPTTEQSPQPVTPLTRSERENRIQQLHIQPSEPPSPLTKHSNPALRSMQPASLTETARTLRLMPITLTASPYFAEARLPQLPGQPLMLDLNKAREIYRLHADLVGRADPAATAIEAIEHLPLATKSAIKGWIEANRTPAERMTIEKRTSPVVEKMLEAIEHVGLIRRHRQGTFNVYEIE